MRFLGCGSAGRRQRLELVARRHVEAQALAAAQDLELHGLLGATADARRSGARVRLDRVHQPLHALGPVLRAQIRRVALPAVDGHDPVARPQHLCRRASRRQLVDHRQREEARRQRVQRPQDEERQHDVDERSRRDHDDALPHLLAQVGPRRDVRRHLLVRTHAGDLHVAAERDRPDRVLGLRALGPPAEDQRREEQREALDAHPDRLGGGEVPGFMQDDQRGEADEGEDVTHPESVAGRPCGLGRLPAVSAPGGRRAPARARPRRRARRDRPRTATRTRAPGTAATRRACAR